MTATAAPPHDLPKAVGWAAFGLLLVFVAAGTARRIPHELGAGALGAALAVGFGAVALLARPVWARGPAVAAASAGIAILGNGTASNLGWFGLCVLAAWCALCASLRVTVAYWFAATLVLTGEWVLSAPHDPGWAAWIGGTSFSVIACLFGRRQRDLLVALRAAQAGLAAQAQEQERNRIARELHDVIAHSLTVSLLHVSAARLALDEDRDEADRALEEAERLGRRSLDEVRHTVGLLRRDGASDPLTPLPGSLDLVALVARFRRAGARVDAELTGDLAGLPDTVGLATYRILQEALTNAVKHAPGGTSVVHVDVTRHSVVLSVDSDGAPRTGRGLGLIGMRERAESLGGTCTAGPGGSGWLVRAEFPLAGS